MNLNPDQTAQLERVATLSDDYRRERKLLEYAHRLMIEEELSALKLSRDIAAWGAHRIGVPKTQIGREGLGTSSPNTVNDAIAAGAKVMEARA